MCIFAVEKRKGCGTSEWPDVGRNRGGGILQHPVGSTSDEFHTVIGADKKREMGSENITHSTVVVVRNEADAAENDAPHVHTFNLYVRIRNGWSDSVD